MKTEIETDCSTVHPPNNNESKGHSCAGAHTFLSEDDPEPRWNGKILTIAQIIKFSMTSAAKAELGALYVTSK